MPDPHYALKGSLSAVLCLVSTEAASLVDTAKQMNVSVTIHSFDFPHFLFSQRRN